MYRINFSFDFNQQQKYNFQKFTNKEIIKNDEPKIDLRGFTAIITYYFTKNSNKHIQTHIGNSKCNYPFLITF